MKPTEWLLLITVALSGCNDDSPTVPSPLTEGAVLYEDPGFRGNSIELTEDVRDLDDLEGGCYDVGSGFDWDDCVSSIRVAPGWTATIYEDPRYRGRSLTVTSEITDLEDVRGPCDDDWDDCISSLRVSRQ